MTYANHIAIAIKDALCLTPEIEAGDDQVEIGVSIDDRYDGATASLTIVTEDGCTFAVVVTRID